VAHKWGDDTGKNEGRISLIPLVRIGIIGTVIVPLVNMIAGGWLIGWGKPAPVDPENFRRHRLYDNLVALAGPASNSVVAALAPIVYRVGNAMDSEIVTRVPWQLVQVPAVGRTLRLLTETTLGGLLWAVYLVSGGNGG
jgi:Zn-dependent protease